VVKDCLAPSIDGLSTYLRTGPIDVDSIQADASHHNHCSFWLLLLQLHQPCCVDVDAGVAVAANDELLLIVQPTILNSVFNINLLLLFVTRFCRFKNLVS